MHPFILGGVVVRKWVSAQKESRELIFHDKQCGEIWKENNEPLGMTALEAIIFNKVLLYLLGLIMFPPTKDVSVLNPEIYVYTSLHGQGIIEVANGIKVPNQLTLK